MGVDVGVDVLGSSLDHLDEWKWLLPVEVIA